LSETDSRDPVEILECDVTISCHLNQSQTATAMSSETTQVDQNAVSADAKLKLEQKLAQRPDTQELRDRNILKNTTVAPALQAAQEKLQRSQLEDKLSDALAKRPRPEELIKEGILQPDEAPPSQ